MTYYNEFDPKAAAWLRELIAAKLIPAGEVDTRSITDVTPNDLSGFAQCHFFAGIGGWPYALRLAGWSDAQPVWTGSCPCQPFSQAGKGLGAADARHLWPTFRQLIAKCSPPVVFGEQVASKAGRDWLAGVRADLEALGYAVGCADLCAAGVGAPHIRQRLFWLADARGGQREQRLWPQRDGLQRPADHGANCGLVDSIGEPGCSGPAGEQDASNAGKPVQVGRLERAGFWSNAMLIPCRDGKARRTEPSIFPLAHGVSGRVALLRGAGNAIVPQVAAEFIKAFTD